MQLYPGFNPEQLNDLRQATVNSENFACVAIYHGLHHYLQKVSPILQEAINVYAAAVHKEGRSPFGIPSQTSPRVSCVSICSYFSFSITSCCDQ